MADIKYHDFFAQLMSAKHDLVVSGDVCKLALYTTSHTPEIDNAVYADLANEHGATGNYALTGFAFTNTNNVVADDDSGDKATFDITEDAVWASSTIAAQYATLYNDTQTSPADPLICQFDFGSEKSSSSGEFRVQFNASGIMEIA